MNHLITTTEQFAKESMKGYDSGHDWWHIERVRKLAKYINSREKLADGFILDIATLLHDTVDSKFKNDNPESGYKKIEEFLDKNDMSEIRDKVINVVRNVSFSNKNPSGDLTDPVLLILQDADKLDAIGAIGVARAFNYGGFRNNPIFIPGGKEKNSYKTTIGHFYDKLLKLKGMMNTFTGRELAEERHQYLEVFLDQFYKEWEFDMHSNKKTDNYQIHIL